MRSDLFGARDRFETGSGPATLYRLSALEKEDGGVHLDRLPFSIRVLLEALLRAGDGLEVKQEDVARLAHWNARQIEPVEVPFRPARVLMQDFTGVPAVVDLAAMRSAARRLGGDPKRISPLVPVDLVIDHSVQVDFFGSAEAAPCNEELEFRRNRERYEFLRWAERGFDNFRIIPPATGIIHQVNLEFLAKVVMVRGGIAFPDTLVGTDSHTTMVNGLGVLGWGVGGIEAEAAMLGQPVYLVTPAVVGVKLTGRLARGGDRYRPGPDRGADPAQKRRGGEVCRILWSRPEADAGGGPGGPCQYGPGVRRHMGFFPIDDETCVTCA